MELEFKFPRVRIQGNLQRYNIRAHKLAPENPRRFEFKRFGPIPWCLILWSYSIICFRMGDKSEEDDE